jgi:hypothetical protein
MSRCISAVAACVAILAATALPADAATGPIHTFGIPGVYGVRAWGTYSA